jgi:hypothetical protein
MTTQINTRANALQALLLRFLDDGAYYRVGDSQPRKADVLKSALLHTRALAPGDLIDSTHFAAPLLGEAIAPRTAAPVNLDSVRPRALVLREAVDEALRLTNGI